MSANAQREIYFKDYYLLINEEVVKYAQEGDNDALEYLINKYKNSIHAKTRNYFLIWLQINFMKHS